MHLHMHQAPAMPSPIEAEREALPVASVRGKTVCRMHGAGSGAPTGNKNANKHGRYSREAIDERRLFAELIRESRELTEIV